MPKLTGAREVPSSADVITGPPHHWSTGDCSCPVLVWTIEPFFVSAAVVLLAAGAERVLRPVTLRDAVTGSVS